MCTVPYVVFRNIAHTYSSLFFRYAVPGIKYRLLAALRCHRLTKLKGLVQSSKYPTTLLCGLRRLADRLRPPVNSCN